MSRRTGWFLATGLAVALVLAFGVSRHASSQPDGLARVAIDEQLDGDERPHSLAGGPFADYSTRGVDDPGLSTGLAGVVGVLATLVVAGGLAWLVSHRSRNAGSPQWSPESPESPVSQ